MSKPSTSFTRSVFVASTPRPPLCRRTVSPWQKDKWTKSLPIGRRFLHQGNSSKPLWTSARVLLLTAFASSLAYAYGVTDAGSHVDELWKEEKAPKYGSTKELEKVGNA